MIDTIESVMRELAELDCMVTIIAHPSREELNIILTSDDIPDINLLTCNLLKIMIEARDRLVK